MIRSARAWKSITLHSWGDGDIMWFVRINDSDCPHKVLTPEKEYSSCKYPNAMYRPKECCERACPVKINERCDD